MITKIHDANEKIRQYPKFQVDQHGETYFMFDNAIGLRLADNFFSTQWDSVTIKKVFKDLYSGYKVEFAQE